MQRHWGNAVEALAEQEENRAEVVGALETFREAALQGIQKYATNRTTRTEPTELQKINSKERQYRGKLNILCWNIEGIRGYIRNCEDNRLENETHQALMLTETFIEREVDCPKIEGAKQFHCLAKRDSDRGRGSGGWLIATRGDPETQRKRISKNVITVTAFGIFLTTAYFPPGEGIDEILTEIGEHFQNQPTTMPWVLYGDFNCRIDSNDPRRGRALADALRTMGFNMLNREDVATFIGRNGSSVIDLVFVRNLTNPQLRVTPDDWTQHQPLELCLEWKTSPKITRPKPIRRVDQTLLEKEIARHRESLNADKDIETRVTTLNSIFRSTTKKATTRRHHHKPWFDDECKQAKSSLLREKRGEGRYFEMKTEYKKLCKKKKLDFELENLKTRIVNSRTKPWLLLPKTELNPQSPIDPQTWHKYFSELLGSSLDPRLPEPIQTQPSTEYPNTPFTNEEVMSAIRKMKRGKAIGPDLIGVELYKDNPILVPLLCRFMNMIFDGSELPNTWTCCTLKPIFKKGDILVPGNYRGISFECHVYKLLTAIITKRLLACHGDSIHENQFGFMPKRNCQQAINKPLQTLDEHGGRAHAAFVDFRKAFDSVPRDELLRCLHEEYGISSKMFGLIRKTLEAGRVVVDDGVTKTDEILQTIGLPQGDSLSPLLFILYVNSVLKRLNRDGAVALMYADDLCIMCETPDQLRLALRRLQVRCEELHLIVNTEKTKVMSFRPAGRKLSKPFCFSRSPIEFVSSFKYLGITLTPGLSFAAHIEDIACKCAIAAALMGDLRKFSLFSCLQLYLLKILPYLEYALPAFAERLTWRNLVDLDKIKARFLKKCLGVFKYTSNTLVYYLCSECTFVEEMDLRGIEFDRVEMTRYLDHRREKVEQLMDMDCIWGPALSNIIWKQELQTPLRVAICRLTSHGFHHRLCRNSRFHTPSEECRCKLCGASASLYHIEACPAFIGYDYIEKSKIADNV